MRERTDLLLSLFVREDRRNLRKSGTEEKYDEKERLLQEVYDKAKEYDHVMAARREVFSISTEQNPAPNCESIRQDGRPNQSPAEAIFEGMYEDGSVSVQADVDDMPATPRVQPAGGPVEPQLPEAHSPATGNSPSTSTSRERPRFLCRSCHGM